MSVRPCDTSLNRMSRYGQFSWLYSGRMIAMNIVSAPSCRPSLWVSGLATSRSSKSPVYSIA